MTKLDLLEEAAYKITARDRRIDALVFLARQELSINELRARVSQLRPDFPFLPARPSRAIDRAKEHFRQLLQG